MSLTFYRAPMSTASVTELVLAELGTPHKTVTLDLKKGETKKAEFLKLNPNGRVPTIVHDGTVVFESTAIDPWFLDQIQLINEVAARVAP